MYDCASFGGVDGSDLLHLCFDHRPESDPDTDLYKNVRFLLRMFLFFMKLTFVWMHEASVILFFLLQRLCTLFHTLHVQIFKQKNILGQG